MLNTPWTIHNIGHLINHTIWGLSLFHSSKASSFWCRRASPSIGGWLVVRDPRIIINRNWLFHKLPFFIPPPDITSRWNKDLDPSPFLWFIYFPFILQFSFQHAIFAHYTICDRSSLQFMNHNYTHSGIASLSLQNINLSLFLGDDRGINNIMAAIKRGRISALVYRRDGTPNKV